MASLLLTNWFRLRPKHGQYLGTRSAVPSGLLSHKSRQLLSNTAYSKEALLSCTHPTPQAHEAPSTLFRTRGHSHRELHTQQSTSCYDFSVFSDVPFAAIVHMHHRIYEDRKSQRHVWHCLVFLTQAVVLEIAWILLIRRSVGGCRRWRWQRDKCYECRT